MDLLILTPNWMLFIENKSRSRHIINANTADDFEPHFHYNRQLPRGVAPVSLITTNAAIIAFNTALVNLDKTHCQARLAFI